MRLLSLLFALLLTTLLGGCTGNSNGFAPTPGTLTLTITDAADSKAIAGATIIVYDASTNEPIAQGYSDANGKYQLSLNTGAYTVRITAQGFYPVPPRGQDALPLQVVNAKQTSQAYALESDPTAANSGSISGRIESPDGTGIASVLVVAGDTALGASTSTQTGPDGDFVLHNLAPGSYALNAYRAGYRQSSAPGAVVIAVGEAISNELRVLQTHANANLGGKVSFLAVVNGNVDITLVHPDTLDAIPGLSTENDENNDYLIRSVPPGNYLAWASYRNDGYVMDPDSIRKFGLPQVSFTATSGDQALDFDVTDAITLIAPSNPAGQVIPVEVTAQTPRFSWNSYPSTKEYIIEITDRNGQVIWGGYDALGNILHQAIPFATTRVDFNFDGSASSALVPGQTYRWRLYADSDTAPGVQGLISSSEGLMGLFTYAPTS